MLHGEASTTALFGENKSVETKSHEGMLVRSMSCIKVCMAESVWVQNDEQGLPRFFHTKKYDCYNHIFTSIHMNDSIRSFMTLPVPLKNWKSANLTMGHRNTSVVDETNIKAQKSWRVTLVRLPSCRHTQECWRGTSWLECKMWHYCSYTLIQ